MGKIELYLPNLGEEQLSLEFATKEIEKMLREKVPEEFRDSVIVSAFQREDKSGLAIEFDDRAEKYIHVALESQDADNE